jgi:hypothetical protein
MKLLVGPIVRWALGKLLKWGLMHQWEYEDLKERLENFGKEMIDAQAGVDLKKGADTPGRRDRFRNRTIVVRPRTSNVAKSSVQNQGKAGSATQKSRLRFRSRRTGAFRR